MRNLEHIGRGTNFDLSIFFRFLSRPVSDMTSTNHPVNPVHPVWFFSLCLGALVVQRPILALWVSI